MPRLDSSNTVSTGIERLKNTFNVLDANNLHLLNDIYVENVQFTDPFATVTDRESVKRYFRSHYANLESCVFHYHEQIVEKEKACLRWSMTFRHPRIGGGKEISTDGLSILRFDEMKVAEHRDYYDAAALMYEHIPLIGAVIRGIRRRVNV